MSQTIDMATALEMTLDDEQEAKFTAFRNLNLKKIKYLMSSIDAKDKEIAKLKILGKDNRRTQMIQALRNKIKDQDLVNDVIKEELSKRAGISLQDANDLIIRKTLGGPKRFRPLSREELENKIIDLEKRLNKKVIGTKMEPSAASDAKSESNSNSQSKSASRASAGNADEAKDSPDSSAKTVALLDEIQSLRMALDAKEGIVSLQQEEVMRLRARNAELVSSEEEIGYLEQQCGELRSYNDSLVENLEETTRKLAESLEITLRIKADYTLSSDNHKNELVALQRQCEKLLKQNASLLQSLSEQEAEMETVGHETNKTLQRSKSAEAGIQSMDSLVHSLQDKLARVEEKLVQSEARGSAAEIKLAQVETLKDQLREKNIAIKELKRTIEERDKAVTNLKAANKALGGSAAPAVSSSTAATTAETTKSISAAPQSSSPVRNSITYDADAKSQGEVRRSYAK